MIPILEISIVIPVYNEGKSILETIASLREALSKLNLRAQIIAVDDGSTDDTYEHLSKSGITVIRHPQNQGYGAALKSGIAAAEHEYIVITDADLTYPIDQLPDLLAKADIFDMVVGARQGKFYHGSWLKRILRIVFRNLVEFATGRQIPDINSGFRVFRKSQVVYFFPLLTPGFSFTTTITLLFMLSGRRVEYVPVQYHKRAGKSHVKLVRDGLRSFQFIVEAMLIYNPIKAFLLLSYLYSLCILPVFAGAIWLPSMWVLCLTLMISTFYGLIGLGFLATSIQLGRIVKMER